MLRRKSEDFLDPEHTGVRSRLARDKTRYGRPSNASAWNTDDRRTKRNNGRRITKKVLTRARMRLKISAAIKRLDPIDQPGLSGSFSWVCHHLGIEPTFARNAMLGRITAGACVMPP